MSLVISELSRHGIVMADDTELYKQYSDNESFRKWLADTVFMLTYTNEIKECLRSRKEGHV